VDTTPKSQAPKAKIDKKGLCWINSFYTAKETTHWRKIFANDPIQEANI
jgi:hypothetical protein